MAKILIVEDDEHIRLLYKEELTDEGHQVTTADSGYFLLKIVERDNPDLIILDIKLGDCNGLDLLQDIRNRYYDLPIIICTAYYSDFKEDWRAIAANFFIVKSFDLTELHQKVGMALAEALIPKE